LEKPTAINFGDPPPAPVIGVVAATGREVRRDIKAGAPGEAAAAKTSAETRLRKASADNAAAARLWRAVALDLFGLDVEPTNGARPEVPTLRELAEVEERAAQDNLGLARKVYARQGLGGDE